MAQIIAIDYGTRFIGLAISDETRLIATTLPTVRVPRGREPLPTLLKALEINNIEQIVIGYPSGLDNKPTQMSREIEKFSQELEKRTGIKTKLWNETYTSQQAETIKLKKKSHDSHSHAARIILQEYLDHLNSEI